MNNIEKISITPRRRANLEKLADYLESLPEDYSHFAMDTYQDHCGSCDLAESDDEIKEINSELDKLPWYDRPNFYPETHLYAKSIETFLGNCGTVACAIGHGPAAGIPLAKAHIRTNSYKGMTFVTGIRFDAYALLFTRGEHEPEWDWLFGAEWSEVDNHHWGAAARIRYLLDKGGIPLDSCGFRVTESDEAPPFYEPYRVDRRQPATV